MRRRRGDAADDSSGLHESLLGEEADEPSSSVAGAIRVLQLVSSARSVSELAAHANTVVNSESLLQVPEARLPAAVECALATAAAAAACRALQLVATMHCPVTSDRLTAASVFVCASAVLPCVVELLERARTTRSAAFDEEETKDLMRAMAAASRAAAAHIMQPWRAVKGVPVRADCMVGALNLAPALLNAALLLVGTCSAPGAGNGVPTWCAAEVGALSSALPRMLLAALQSDAAPTSQESGLAAGMAGGVAAGVTIVLGRRTALLLEAASGVISSSQHEDMRSDVEKLGALFLGLQAAAVHQQQAGCSCIPADPLVAVGLSSGTGSSSSSSDAANSSQQHTAAAPLLVVPAFHKALLRLVPRLDVILQDPEVLQQLVEEGSGFAVWGALVAALHARSSSRVPQLQMLIELAVLYPQSRRLVSCLVDAMMLLVVGPAASRSCQEAAGSSSSHRPSTEWQLQAAQAAGLLAPVLHLLSAAVMHALGAAAEGGDDTDPLPSAQQASLAGQFVALVVTVVLPVAPRHLAAAICQQPLRSLAALELTVRLLSAGLVPPHLTVALNEGVAFAVAEACRAFAFGKLEAVLAGSDSATAALVSNHLLALLASCLKCCSRADSHNRRAWGLAVSALHVVGHAALLCAHAVAKAAAGCTSSTAQAAISSCGAAHWLHLAGRVLAAHSQMLLQRTAQEVLATASAGFRARLEGQLQLATATAAVDIIQAAGRLATSPAATPGQSYDAAAHAAADAAGGTGLALLCSHHGSIRPGDKLLGMLVQVLQLSNASLAQSSSSSSSSESRLALLQQLEQAADDMQQQLDGYCGRAERAVVSRSRSALADGCSSSSRDPYAEVVRQAADGVCVLRKGVKQHALLNVLHHLRRLQRLGEAVCAALPPPSLICANPACDNVSGLSDMHLVWRRGVCGHCREARFCSVACLRTHWDAHRDPGSLVEALLGGDV